MYNALKRAPKRALVAGTAACVGLLMAIAVASANIPDSTAQIDACYMRTNGALRVIDPSLGQTCGDGESSLNWDVHGYAAKTQLHFTDAVSLVPAGDRTYTQLATIGTFKKLRPGTTIQLVWNGQVGINEPGGNGGSCQFQLRIDGRTDNFLTSPVFSADSGGEAVAAIYPPNYNVVMPVSVTAWFGPPRNHTLTRGPHTVSIWVRGNELYQDDPLPTCTENAGGYGNDIYVTEF
jgi:hypothetical protein